jgi:hypothetical protein
MEKSVLFLGHMTEPEEKVVIGINGPDTHTAILSPEEALRFAYQVIETVERMGGNRHPDDFEEDEE